MRTRLVTTALLGLLIAGPALVVAQTVAPTNSQPQPNATGANDPASRALDGGVPQQEFSPLDTNGDGWLSTSEVNAATTDTPYDFRGADADGDGRVSRAEWDKHADGQDPDLQDAQDKDAESEDSESE